jgi:hypothetical protein
MQFWIILILIYVGFVIIASLVKHIAEIRLNKKADLKKIESDLKEQHYSLQSGEKKLEEEKIFFEGMLREKNDAIENIFHEKSQGFPWLSKAYSDYLYLYDLKIADWLKTKPRPAVKTAEKIKEIAQEKRQIQREYKITKYLLEMYESLFPFLIDFRGEDLDDYIRVQLQKYNKEEVIDEVVIYTTEGERKSLSKQEIFQRAIDRYWQKRKSPWELGRDYERYVGYLYEKQGYSVYYQGIIEGLEDLGRDLIAKKGNEIAVIQCKYWSQYKTIHEKHICQLFGTTLKYWIEHQKSLNNKLKKQKELFPELIKQNIIKGVFITSTTLSKTAHEFADALGIIIKEKNPFEEYPSIKCNISYTTGEKIYHLPFDQQYDRTTIEQERNERYVKTVAEAEQLGFRRAFRWKGFKEK